MLRFSRMVLFAAAVGVAADAFASPARLITAPPVTKTGNPFTGPPTDPLATQGQWFLNNSTGAVESRPWEFYDNNEVFGAIGSQVIEGHVQNITFTGPGGNISGFQIVASITNDLPGIQPPGQPGRNQHGEFLAPGGQYQGTMYDVKMTAEFAFPSQVAVPAAILAQIASNTQPYTRPDYGTAAAQIFAQNEDQEAWYCFSQATNVPGGYHVPTFDFGSILPGQTVSRTLNFAFNTTGLIPSNPLWGLLQTWAANGADVFANRTTDLKIGDWVDVLAQDTGLPYFNPPFQSGNVSVFFEVPEPTTLGMLAPLALIALRRRARR